MSPALQRFGAAVRRARRARGLTQAALGERTRLTHDDISRVEQGHDVKFTKVVALAHALDLDLASIVGIDRSAA